MARSEARIYTTIWNDADYRSLTWQAQWLYFAVLSQPELSMCGVLTVSVERWSRLAGGVKPKQLVDAIAELARKRFIVHDVETAEVWVRSFLRRDGVLGTPNLVVAVARAFDAVHSEEIRQGIVGEFKRVFGADTEHGLRQRFPKGFPDGFAQRFPQGFRDAVHGPCTEVTEVKEITEVTDINSLPDDSSSSQHQSAASGDDDVLGQALAVLANRDLERRTVEKGPVGSRASWLGKAITERRVRHQVDAGALLAQRPGLTPNQLADLLEPADGSSRAACGCRMSPGAGVIHEAGCAERSAS